MLTTPSPVPAPGTAWLSAVSVTAAGQRELVKMRTILARIEDSFFEPLDAAARQALHDALLQLAARHDFRFGPPAP